MMKKIVSVILIVVLSVCISGCSAGTDTGNEDIVKGYFLYAAHSNQSTVTISEDAEEAITQFCLDNPETDLEVISIEGECCSIQTYTTPKGGFGLLESQKRKNAESFTGQVVEESESYVPSTEEANYAEAFEKIGEAEDGAIEVIVDGSGLATAGTVNYCNGVMNVEAGVWLDEAAEKGLIPELSNIKKLTWTNVGKTGGKQQKLTKGQMDRLEALWRGYFKLSGVDPENVNIYRDFDGCNKTDSVTRPSVTVCKLPTVKEVDLSETIRLTESKLAFKTNRPAFKDKDAAEATLGELVPAINSSTSDVVICGFINGENNTSEGIELSKNRALAVKETLVELGADEDKLIAIGAGTGGGKASAKEFHIENATGGDEIKNRIVVITLATSDTGKALLDDFE